jgi:hypothetical protein
MTDIIKVMLMAIIDVSKDKKKIKKRIKEILDDTKLNEFYEGGELRRIK